MLSRRSSESVLSQLVTHIACLVLIFMLHSHPVLRGYCNRRSPFLVSAERRPHLC